VGEKRFRHLAADRGIAAAPRCVDSVSRSYVPRSLKLTGAMRLDEGNLALLDPASVADPSTSFRDGFGLSLPVEWRTISIQLQEILGMSMKTSSSGQILFWPSGAAHC
jgi:hypothetical protein